MKNFYLAAIITLAFFNLIDAKAQSYKHEFSLGVGGASRPFAKDGINFNPADGAGGHKVTSSGAFHLNYQYSIKPKISIGITFVYEQLQHEESPGSSDPSNFWMRKIYEDKQYTLLANLRNKWVQKKWVTLYSDVAVGINFTDRKEARNDFGQGSAYQKYHFAYQITPIGIKVGKQFFAYTELGYGYKGIISAGIGYRL